MDLIRQAYKIVIAFATWAGNVCDNKICTLLKNLPKIWYKLHKHLYKNKISSNLVTIKHLFSRPSSNYLRNLRDLPLLDEVLQTYCYLVNPLHEPYLIFLFVLMFYYLVSRSGRHWHVTMVLWMSSLYFVRTLTLTLFVGFFFR